MTCKKCDRELDLVESSREIESGSFTEVWECPNGHTGTIKGEASDPQQIWTKEGQAFRED